METPDTHPSRLCRFVLVHKLWQPYECADSTRLGAVSADNTQRQVVSLHQCNQLSQSSGGRMMERLGVCAVRCCTHPNGHTSACYFPTQIKCSIKYSAINRYMLLDSPVYSKDIRQYISFSRRSDSVSSIFTNCQRRS